MRTETILLRSLFIHCTIESTELLALIVRHTHTYTRSIWVPRPRVCVWIYVENARLANNEPCARRTTSVGATNIRLVLDQARPHVYTILLCCAAGRRRRWCRMGMDVCVCVGYDVGCWFALCHAHVKVQRASSSNVVLCALERDEMLHHHHRVVVVVVVAE